MSGTPQAPGPGGQTATKRGAAGGDHPGQARRRSPKAIGTAAETAVVKVLREHGFPHAERRALTGAHDQGDITGTPALCWQVKGGDAARTASDAQITKWLHDTNTQAGHACADIAVLVVQRAGIGPANAHRWWAVTWHELGPWPVWMLLADMCAFLCDLGYGTPPNAPARTR